MDTATKRFLETSRRHLTAPAATRTRARILRREAKQFPQSAAVRAAITLLRRSSI